jgi:hypothetical protein
MLMRHSLTLTSVGSTISTVRKELRGSKQDKMLEEVAGSISTQMISSLSSLEEAVAADSKADVQAISTSNSISEEVDANTSNSSNSSQLRISSRTLMSLS